MKRVIIAVILIAVLCSAVYAEVTRPLTEDEQAAVTEYISAREQALTEKFAGPDSTEKGIERMLRSKRLPQVLCMEYERSKMNYPDWSPGTPSQKWLSRPKFPGWTDKCYTWYPNGESYQEQLFCTKCKGKSTPGGKPCNGWVNPSGFTCSMLHPLPLIDQWKFTVELVAKDHDKPIEAMAHLKNALDHEEITEAQWDECIAIIDGIVAAQQAAAEAEAKSAPDTP